MCVNRDGMWLKLSSRRADRDVSAPNTGPPDPTAGAPRQHRRTMKLFAWMQLLMVMYWLLTHYKSAFRTQDENSDRWERCTTSM